MFKFATSAIAMLACSTTATRIAVDAQTDAELQTTAKLETTAESEA